MNNNHHFQLLMMFKHTHTQKAELQELDSQILLTQGQGSCGQGSTMMLMNMNTPPAPMSPPVHHSQQSSTVSNSLGGSVVGGNGNIVGGNHHSSTLGSQPSSIGSSNGYGNYHFILFCFFIGRDFEFFEPNLPQSCTFFLYPLRSCFPSLSSLNCNINRHAGNRFFFFAALQMMMRQGPLVFFYRLKQRVFTSVAKSNKENIPLSRLRFFNPLKGKHVRTKKQQYIRESMMMMMTSMTFQTTHTAKQFFFFP